MLRGQKHIIQKQVLQVRMKDPEDGFQFRSRLGEVYHDRILPQLQTLFDEAGTDSTIRIDRLEIDIGEIEKTNWEEDLANTIIKRMRAELDSVTSKLTQAEQLQKAADNIPKKIDGIEIWLISYLKSGKLPWYFAYNYNINEAVENASIEGELLSGLNEFVQHANRDQLCRFIYLFKTNTLEDVINSFVLPGNAEVLKFINTNSASLINWLKKLKVHPYHTNTYLYLPLLQTLQQRDHILVAGILANFVNNVSRDHNFATDIVMKEMPKVLVSYLGDELNEELITATIYKTEIGGKETSEFLEDDLTEDIFYIDNAGLILVYPFLLPFFTSLELLHDLQFKHTPAQQHATLLTQYLLTEEASFFNQSMQLNKILCGMDANAPLPVSFKASTSEAHEAKQLLETVLEQWRMNGVKINNSIEGLRSSFLCRAGKLEKKNNDWKLVVEQKPYDMVLASLPWAIGVIKTPWMKGMLWVEWT